MQTIIYKNAILLRLKAKKAGATRRECHIVAKKKHQGLDYHDKKKRIDLKLTLF